RSGDRSPRAGCSAPPAPLALREPCLARLPLAQPQLPEVLPADPPAQVAPELERVRGLEVARQAAADEGQEVGLDCLHDRHTASSRCSAGAPGPAPRPARRTACAGCAPAAPPLRRPARSRPGR